MKRLSPISNPFGAIALSLIACGIASLGGCVDEQPLRVELDTQIAFDPTRFDAGTPPVTTEPLPSVLRFGITPFYSPDRQRRMMDRLQAYLGEEVGVPVVTTIFPDYASCVAALARGDLDVAQLSPFAFVQAEAQIEDLLPLASSVAQGSMTYGSYLVSRRGSKITTWKDVKGKRVGFIDRLSTSGYLYPRIFLEEKGIDLDRDLASITFYGQHDRALNELLADNVDVVAVSSDTLVNANVMGIHGPVRVVAKAGRIPYDAVVVRKTMSPLIRWRLRRAILTLSIHSGKGRDVLEDYNLINGFMPVPKDHYSEVRRRAAKLLKPLTNVQTPPPRLRGEGDGRKPIGRGQPSGELRFAPDRTDDVNRAEASPAAAPQPPTLPLVRSKNDTPLPVERATPPR